MKKTPTLILIALGLAACDAGPKTTPTPSANLTAPRASREAAPSISPRVTGDTTPPAETAATAPPSTHALMPAGSAPKGSIYELGLTLESQRGTPFALDTLAGHPTLVAMFYAKCGYACPTLIQDLEKLEQALPEDQRRQVHVLLVTFDPVADTPAVLGELVTRHGVDAARWTFARAPDDEATRELAGALGIKYRRLPDGHFNHTTLITLLDAHGVPLARIDGLRQDSTALRAVITTTLGL